MSLDLGLITVIFEDCMKILLRTVLCTVTCCLLSLFSVRAQISFKHLEPGDGIQWVSNKGQFAAPVVFRAFTSGGTLFAEKNALTMYLHHPADHAQYHDFLHHRHTQLTEFTYRTHAFRMRFVGVQDVQPEGNVPYPFYHNYFLGNQSQSWAGKVPVYAQIYYPELYPGIGLRVYSGENDALKYDWTLAPGARIEQIKLHIEGADQLSVTGGKLRIHTSVGILEEHIPEAYQYIDGKKVLVDCSYQLENGLVGFTIGKYQPELPLIIDPVLIFATYSGSKGDNFGFTATYDSRGNLYAGGITDGSTADYPVTTGAFQTRFAGGQGLFPANLACDISISKYDSSGRTLLWASYLGGRFDDYPHSLVVDLDDNLHVYGTSYSDNFATTNNAFQRSRKGVNDIIVSKISEDGSRLLASTYVGGSGRDGLNAWTNSSSNDNPLRYNYADDYRGDIIVDPNGLIYVSSCTNSSDFPTENASQSSFGGKLDGCVFALSPDMKNLVWSTYLGGSEHDALYSIRLDDQGNVYVAGGTRSNNLPSHTDAHQKQIAGNTDAVIAKYRHTNFSLGKLSYWGSSSYDQAYFVEIDRNDNVFISGQTTGTITQTSGTYGNNNKGQFIVKMDSALNSVLMQTTIGARNNRIDFSPTAFLVDNCDNIYLSGWGADVRDMNPGSTLNLPISSDALQKTTDGNDFYLIALSKDAGSLVYATYFGGDSSKDHVDGGTSRFDKRGVVYQSVCASCPERVGQAGFNDFPVTAGAVFEKNISPRCSNASFKIDFRLSNPVDAAFTALPPQGCAPLTVQFQNKSIGAKTYTWYFGDGDSSTDFSPKHTYTDTGQFKVTLIVRNPDACNVIDSTSQTIQVYNFSKADFEAETFPCQSKVVFRNKSINAYRSFWSFGDGKIDSADNPTHQYHNLRNTYTVTLITENRTGCADTIQKQVYVDYRDSLHAAFTPRPPGACAPAQIFFENQSIGGTEFYWDMGDGADYNTFEPTHTYWIAGTYPVRLIVKDTARCNPLDTVIRTVEVYEQAMAAINVITEPCDRVVYLENLSVNGKVVQWDLGDGNTSESPDTLTHRYDKDGFYVIILRINPGTSCYDSVLVVVEMRFRDTVSATFTGDPLQGCVPVLVDFQNQSYGGTEFTWDFGDGKSDNSISPLHEYRIPGTYRVILKVEDPTSCNIEDRDTAWVKVGLPTRAFFSYEKALCTNEFSFKNESESSATHFSWDFGTGDPSTSRDPEFEFLQSGTYTVRLIANPDSLCPDTFEQSIDINYDAAGDLIIPNVFTPNHDGVNDCFQMGGISVECDEIKWIIYNRWGEVVFRSEDPKGCWDGTNIDSQLPMPEGVYYSIIDLTRSLSGEKQTISGTVTLIRDK